LSFFPLGSVISSSAALPSNGTASIVLVLKNITSSCGIEVSRYIADISLPSILIGDLITLTEPPTVQATVQFTMFTLIFSWYNEFKTII
jgi:hypothetical protein